MNVKATGMASSYMQSPFDGVSIYTGGKKTETKKVQKAASSPEEAFANHTIEKFQEENDPQAKRLERILSKFRGGKELSPSELEYLAKHAPEAYKEVCEVLKEREQLERELEMAESTMEVMQAYNNALTMVSETSGTGEQAKQQAFKTMARTNNLADVYRGFVATPEYRALEDEGDKAEEIREGIEEEAAQVQEHTDSAEELTNQAEELTDQPEKVKPSAEFTEGNHTNNKYAKNQDMEAYEQSHNSKYTKRRFENNIDIRL